MMLSDFSLKIVIIRKWLKQFAYTTLFCLQLFCAFGSIQNAGGLTDTVMIDKMNVKVFHLIKSSDLEKSSNQINALIDSIMNYSVQQDYLLGIGIAYSLKGKLNRYLDRNQSAIVFYDSALMYLDLPSDKGPIYNSLSRIYRDVNMLDSALALYDKTIEIRQKYDTAQSAVYGINKLFCDKSEVFLNKGDYVKAFKTLEEAEVLSLKRNCPSCIADINIYKSIFYRKTGDCNKSLTHALKAMVDSNELNENQKLYALEIIGNVYYKCFQDYEKAKEYFEMSFTKSEKSSRIGFQFESKFLLSIIYFQEGLYDKAEKLLVDIISFATINEVDRMGLKSKILLGDIASKRNNWNQAKEYYLQASLLANQEFDLSELQKVHDNLFSLYQQEGNFEKALHHNILQQQYQDAILNKDRLKEFRELETKYETKEKQSKIDFLEKESKYKTDQIKTQRGQKVLVTLLSGLALLIIALLFYGYSSKQKLERLSEKTIFEKEQMYRDMKISEKEKEILETQQKLLLAQLNPHFIFNSLSSIEAYIMNNQKLEASDYLADFGELMRLVLQNSRKQFLLLSDEVNMLTGYLKLEQHRLRSKFSFKFFIDEEVNLEIKVPCMMIQPFLENAIQHGIMNIENGNINIKILPFKSEYIKVVIEDNGLGLDSNRETSAKRGLSASSKIILERIEILKQKFGNAISLSIKNKTQLNGVEVEIIIPFLK